MAKSRYKNTNIFVNEEEIYEGIRQDRKVNSITHYATPKLSYPSEATRKSLMEIPHVWSHGDKYWKLAQTHYKNPEYWWVIAWYNLKPTDAHCKIGEVILIPKPLGKILKNYGY